MTKGPQINSPWELLGFDSDASAAFQTVMDEIIAGLQRIADARMAVAEAAVEEANKEVEALQKVLDYERQARANGYANRVEIAQKDLELAKKNQQKALEQKKKAQEEQERIDSLTPISPLVHTTTSV